MENAWDEKGGAERKLLNDPVTAIVTLVLAPVAPV